jgi:hypothetical protein
LYGSLRWLSAPSLRWAVLIGFALGAAALYRVLVVPWIAVLLAFLLIAEGWSRIFQPARVKALVLAGAVAAVCIAPVLARNVALYGAWALTPQSGMHLAFWVVPLVKEAKDGTVWAASNEEIKRRVETRFGATPENPFEESRRYSVIGREVLAELGVAAIAKAWVVGALINLGAPALIISPPVSTLPRTGFFATSGGSTFEKITNFLFRADNALYVWLLLIGLAGVVVWRGVQAVGMISLIREGTAWPAAGLFGLWFVYVLLVNGPVASPKYRLPLEPVLMVLMGAGASMLRSRGKRLQAPA